MLKMCLDSIAETAYENFETIVVDDGSTDGSADYAKELQQKNSMDVSVIETKANMGAAAARNLGASHSRGDYLAFLDSDTQVDQGWLSDPISTMTEDPTVAAIQCKLMLMTDHHKFDYAGDHLSQFGFLAQRVDFGQLDDGKLPRADIFGVKSAAMLIRRDVFMSIGMFDEDFFIYLEETDLCWRVWLSGCRVQFLPTSIVYHKFGDIKKLASRNTKFLSKYYGPRNYVTTILKDAGGVSLIKIVPLHIFCWIGIGLWHCARGRLREGIWISRGIAYNLWNFRSIWRKRLMIQYLVRRVGDNTIMPHIMVRISPMYLYRKATDEGSGWKL
jgi:GT2 family glycosyltransferase